MDNLIAARSQMAMSLASLAAACNTQDPSPECHFLVRVCVLHGSKFSGNLPLMIEAVYQILSPRHKNLG